MTYLLYAPSLGTNFVSMNGIFMLDLEVILLSSTEITLIINKGSLNHHSFNPNMINDLCVWMQYFVNI